MSTEDASTSAGDGQGQAPLPRDPSAYRPSNHFLERFEDRYHDGPSRHLDGEIVRSCIEHGEVAHRQRDAVHFHEEFGGVTYRIVVNPEKRTVVTGYPVSINPAAARESGRWSTAAIEDLRKHIAANQ